MLLPSHTPLALLCFNMLASDGTSLVVDSEAYYSAALMHLYRDGFTLVQFISSSGTPAPPLKSRKLASIPRLQSLDAQYLLAHFFA